MSGRTVYLDYAAATPMDLSARKAMAPYFSEEFYNPSASYLPARAVKQAILEAIRAIASHVGAKPAEIIHTSGGTESNNLAIAGTMERYPDKTVLASAVEHESVLVPAKKYKNKLIPVDKYGMVDLKALQKLADEEVVLISVMLANNEVATIQPIREIAEMIRQIRISRRERGIDLPIYLHTDAAQAPCYMDVHAKRLGADMMTLGGGKIYGPKQSGILFVAAGTGLEPQILGGGQQRGMRSGTQSAAMIAGLARALDIAAEKRKAESVRVTELRQAFAAGLSEINPDITLNGHPKKNLPHILSVTFPGTDNERLLFGLEDRGVLAASGSACSASSDEPSHVLGAMGLSDQAAKSSLRFSFGRPTTPADIKRALKALEDLLR